MFERGGFRYDREGIKYQEMYRTTITIFIVQEYNRDDSLFRHSSDGDF